MISKADLQLFSVRTNSAFGGIKGSWRNELGSLMTVEDQTKDGLFSGTYESTVSGNEKPVKGTLTGFVAGDTIGFAVDWRPTFDSVTSWSGKILATPDGSPFLYTLWILSRGVKDKSDWWQSFLNGSDRFWCEGP